MENREEAWAPEEIPPPSHMEKKAPHKNKKVAKRSPTGEKSSK